MTFFKYLLCTGIISNAINASAEQTINEKTKYWEFTIPGDWTISKPEADYIQISNNSKSIIGYLFTYANPETEEFNLEEFAEYRRFNSDWTGIEYMSTEFKKPFHFIQKKYYSKENKIYCVGLFTVDWNQGYAIYLFSDSDSLLTAGLEIYKNGFATTVPASRGINEWANRITWLLISFAITYIFLISIIIIIMQVRANFKQKNKTKFKSHHFLFGHRKISFYYLLLFVCILGSLALLIAYSRSFEIYSLYILAGTILAVGAIFLTKGSGGSEIPEFELGGSVAHGSVADFDFDF